MLGLGLNHPLPWVAPRRIGSVNTFGKYLATSYAGRLELPTCWLRGWNDYVLSN
jgi:hypothetical protein